VFGCTPVPPERDLSGEWLDRAVALDNVRIKGIHLRLPGWGEQGPTLEIFQYVPEAEGTEAVRANTPGFGHIAFEVDDVAETADAIRRHGGTAIGQRVARSIKGAGRIKFQYMADPEGNIIEIQRWE
jgi:catechol 2,3-dioxygenase-like lactoylglutathione lyase family enzyme